MRDRSAPTLLALLCISPVALGCGGDDGGNTDAGGPSSAGTVLLRDNNNYRATSALSIPSIETASGTDLDICWTDVTSDLQCHELMPQAAVNNVGLLRLLNLTEAEAEEQLASGQLSMSQVDGYLQYNTDHQSTCAKLSSMTFLGTPIDVEAEYTESSGHTYMLVFTESTDPGGAAYAMTFVKPTANSTNTTVNASEGCGLLEFEADLSTPDTVPIPLDGPWLVDWRNVTIDGQGYPIDVGGIDGVLLGFYENKTVDDLEAELFDLELIATDIWEIRLEQGRTAQLEFAQHRGDGSLFAGFDPSRQGVWLIALTCSTCPTPAPILLSILDPGAPQP